MKRAHIRVRGLVHGVGFRSYAKRYAEELEIKGFVKNLRDGSVEVVVEGYDKQINLFLQILRKGPWGAKVQDIDVDYEEPRNEFRDFRIEA